MEELYNLHNISAEMLLDTLYPQLEEEGWTVKSSGAFYRNYNEDMMSMDEENKVGELSRNSLLHVLPQGVFADEEDLRNMSDPKAKLESVHINRNRMKDFFVPFNTYDLYLRLKVEREVSDLLSRKLEFVQKAFFGYFIDKEKNPLIREAAQVLPYAPFYRGDIEFVKQVISSVMECDVTVSNEQWRDDLTAHDFLTKIMFTVYLPPIPIEEYENRLHQIQELNNWIAYWFLPIEVVSEIVFASEQKMDEVGSTTLLNYNSYLKDSL